MKVIYGSKLATFFGTDFIIWPFIIFFRHPLVRMDPREELYPIATRIRIIKRVGPLAYYFQMTLGFFTNCFRDTPIYPFKALERNAYRSIRLTLEENNLFYN
jgi:hypothetical protein